MATLRLATSARNAAVKGITDLIDAGSGPGTIKIYSGAQPATPNTAASGTLLATVGLGDPSFGAPSNGVVAGADPAAVNAVATGAAGWCRVADSDGNAVFDGSVGTSGSDLNFDSVSWTAGGTVSISSGTVTQPTA